MPTSRVIASAGPDSDARREPSTSQCRSFLRICPTNVFHEPNISRSNNQSQNQVCFTASWSQWIRREFNIFIQYFSVLATHNCHPMNYKQSFGFHLVNPSMIHATLARDQSMGGLSTRRTTHPSDIHISPHWEMTTSCSGLFSACVTRVFSILVTTSIPSTTRPKTTCLPFK